MIGVQGQTPDELHQGVGPWTDFTQPSVIEQRTHFGIWFVEFALNTCLCAAATSLNQQQRLQVCALVSIDAVTRLSQYDSRRVSVVHYQQRGCDKSEPGLGWESGWCLCGSTRHSRPWSARSTARGRKVASNSDRARNCGGSNVAGISTTSPLLSQILTVTVHGSGMV